MAKKIIRPKKENYRKSNVDKKRFDSQNKNHDRVSEGVFIYQGQVNVQTLSEKLNLPIAEIIKFLFLEGKMVNINSMLDDELIGLVCLNFEFDFRKEEVKEAANFEDIIIEDDSKDLSHRPAIVTIMGHVDHGKTTLLDRIRKSRVVEKEFGGITQAIGAYQIDYKGQKITFLDTPGHEAFAAMRARGADVTDIIILVVAADDGVMPQTKEAIDHAKLAQVPVIVAVNKIDKAGPDEVERIKTTLTDYDLLPEEWGGTTIYKPISAKMGIGIEELLENIVLLAEVKELKANAKRYAIGRVIEAELDKGLGAVATLIVQNGTLNVGDSLVVGSVYGKVRNMYDDVGRQIKLAPPSTPVRITGLSEVPQAGDSFMAFADDRQARAVADERRLKKTMAERDSSNIATNLDELMAGHDGQVNINVLIKADSQGSAEAVKASIEKIDITGFKMNVIRAQAGMITESDILLASAGKAIIYGFNVRPDAKVKAKADEEKVEVRLYRIIYQLIEDLEKELIGQIKPELREVVMGQAEVRQLFKISKIGTIAGAFVTSGLIKNHSDVRLIRQGIVIFEGKISTLKRFKDEAREVKVGFDCGIMIENYNDLKENDIIECYEMKVKE